jgi:hypothetical protein
MYAMSWVFFFLSFLHDLKVWRGVLGITGRGILLLVTTANEVPYIRGPLG